MLLQTNIDPAAIDQIRNSLSEGFWMHTNFWIEIVLALFGIFIGWLAYKEAKKAFGAAGEAKNAATAAEEAALKAGSVVKIQTITIELTEIIQSLSKLSPEIKYNDARDFYNQINTRIRRNISRLSNHPDCAAKTTEILETLKTIKTNLDGTRPSSNKDDTLLDGISIYYAIEGAFSNLSGQLADFCGLLEQKSI